MRTLRTIIILPLVSILMLNAGCEQKEDFQYKQILEDWIDVFGNEDIPGLFGTWSIVEIAQVGGTLRDEHEIQRQLGKKLSISKNEISFDLWESKIITNPTYDVVSIHSNEGPNLKGSSFFHGYRTCRENVFFLVAKGTDSMTMNFEIIHYMELVLYYDGRLFFLQKD